RRRRLAALPGYEHEEVVSRIVQNALLPRIGRLPAGCHEARRIVRIYGAVRYRHRLEALHLPDDLPYFRLCAHAIEYPHSGHFRTDASRAVRPVENVTASRLPMKSGAPAVATFTRA